ncbi:MAG: cytochrome c peroxidase [Gemmataceae bacterium]
MKRFPLACRIALALVFALLFLAAPVRAQDKGIDWLLPSAKKKAAFDKETPIVFVNSRMPEWSKLPSYWNVLPETATHPVTGAKAERKVVKIKMPLGLTVIPPIPPENPLTLQRWELGRKLYFDPILSADGTVSCATCHDPKRGFTDQAPVSTGIGGNKGGMSAPTVMNSAFHPFQFWDGRARSLEDQAQGPVQNPLEMCLDSQHAWRDAVLRVRKNSDYVKRFLEAFGHEPTRDGIAMAIAGYERTVLNGNSVTDRADAAMRKRVIDEEGSDFTVKPVDYATALKDAIAKKDMVALKALRIDPAADEANLAKVADQLSQGRTLFFGKARCSLCHAGENFSDGLFHNLGVGVKEGKLSEGGLGRYAALPTGHKNPEAVGAFKTPILRGLVSTAPYMHDGSEKTLEEVVEFYERGGNANEYLSPKMRDLVAEQAYVKSQAGGEPYKGPKVFLLGADKTPIVPFQLRLTKDEKAALVRYLRSLEGEVDPIVADPGKKAVTAAR